MPAQMGRRPGGVLKRESGGTNPGDNKTELVLWRGKMRMGVKQLKTQRDRKKKGGTKTAVEPFATGGECSLGILL